jgi:hypothetical protein
MLLEVLELVQEGRESNWKAIHHPSQSVSDLFRSSKISSLYCVLNDVFQLLDQLAQGLKTDYIQCSVCSVFNLPRIWINS